MNTNALAQMDAQFEGGSKKFSKPDLTKYFSEKLQNGQNNATKTIRIIQRDPNASPFFTAYFHERYANGRSDKFLCLAKNGKDQKCPYCEAHEVAEQSVDPNIKDNAYLYRAAVYFMCEVIDREKEHEGIKWWRFKRKYKGDGTMDEIYPIIKAQYANNIDPLDPQNGVDLTITLKRVNKASVITSVVASAPRPVVADMGRYQYLLNESKPWTDVYREKTADYLDIVLGGGTPRWDEKQKKFVAFVADDASGELTTTGTPMVDKTDAIVDTPSLSSALAAKAANALPDNLVSGAVDDLPW